MNRLAVFVLLITFSVNCFSQESKLGQSKNELSGGSKYSRTYDNTTSSYSSEKRSGYHESDGVLAEIFGEILIKGIFLITIGLYSDENHLYNYYTPYPYFNGYSGNYEPEHDGKSYTRFTIENNIYNALTDKTFSNRLKGKVNFRHFGIQGDWLQMHESSPKTNLALFNLSFSYDRLRFQRFNWGWNIGANYVGSGVDKLGVSIGTTAELFLFKRAGLYASAKVSRINMQPVNQLEFRAKRYINKFYISGGYETLKIGSPRYHYMTAGVGVCL